MIAIAVGTGVGINAVVAYYNGLRNYEKAEAAAGTGAPLAFVLWVLFSIITWFVLPYYVTADLIRGGHKGGSPLR